MDFSKWVACYGNAISIIDQVECNYAKNLSLRYPVRMCFSGSRLRLHFSNITGTEDVCLTKVNVSKTPDAKSILAETIVPVTFNGQEEGIIPAGGEIVSDEVSIDITEGQLVMVSIYLKECTQMNSGVLITGPLSKGYFAYGDHVDAVEFPDKLSRTTKWFYFLSTIDIFTEEKNSALICYGDSITAQSWPDYLTLKLSEEGVKNVSVIRRAISGTRILREYDCITYAAYGMKGVRRFVREMQTAGADKVIIQHGINDIIHPVGVEVNRYRPWEDMPSTEDLINGVKEIYLNPAKEMGLSVYSGTLLPIFGWRTYAPFRDEIRNEFNEWLRSSEDFIKCIDFDRTVRDAKKPECFGDGFDSGDHLHPSEAAYKAMADEAYRTIWE